MAIVDYLFGDLTQTDEPHVAHQVNCQGAFASGIAGAYRERFPETYRDYMDFWEENRHQGENLLGMVALTRLPVGVSVIQAPYVFHCFSQWDYGRKKQLYTNYEALRKALKVVFRTVRGLNDGFDRPRRVAMPKIGCGLGGGDWKVVSDIIEAESETVDVFIYDLK